MTKIKIVGALIFVLSMSLAVLSISMSKNHTQNNDILDTINQQKDFTQEISKNIFYIYKNKNQPSEKLDALIQKFIDNMNNKSIDNTAFASKEMQKQNEKILVLWNQFYLYVQKFRDNTQVATLYSNILLEGIVKDIYNTNLKLLMEFNKLINLNQHYFNASEKKNKNIQYTLFLLLIFLLIYLFFQVNMTISFIQKFLITSKNIISSSSIENLEYMDVEKKSDEVLEATNNFNHMVDKINNSIEHASQSLEHSYKSLEVCEENIEELMELFSDMQENDTTEDEFTKKEDALILSLEELSISSKNLQNMKLDLEKLISKRK